MQKKKRGKAVASVEDRISTLPDDVLNLVLSSLPADEAVRTSVLAKRWHHLWRSARAVRITHRGKKNWTPRSLTNFLNHLLLLRAAGSPIDEVEIGCSELDDDGCYNWDSDCDFEYCHEVPRSGGIAQAKDMCRSAGLWIRHALSSCNARVLNISFYKRRRLCLDDVLFVSIHLTKAVFSYATFKSPVLDFSMCPALEHLEISMSKIRVSRISSESVTHLSITYCSFHSTARTRISTPRVISLQLSLTSGRAPFIESMPLLKAAQVSTCNDCCADMCKSNTPLGDCGSRFCGGCRRNSDGSSVLLQGLSDAVNLELTSHPNVFVFRKDCMFSTTFANLKELVLNEWCMVPNFAALDFFLRYSPILEKLTLQLEYFESKHVDVKVKRNKRPRENFLASKQLKVVKIKYRKNKKVVDKVSKFLNAYGISEEQISIEPDFCPPRSCDYYESTDSEGYW